MSVWTWAMLYEDDDNATLIEYMDGIPVATFGPIPNAEAQTLQKAREKSLGQVALDMLDDGTVH